ncbi:MAG: VWA domain-containing protein [Thermoanaerobaculia bacterium]
MNALPQFADPLWLLALLAAPFLVWRHHARATHGALLASRLPRATGGNWRLHLPFYFRLFAFVAMVVALGRPRLGYSWEEATTEGIDIQIVVDTSGSMGAEDFQPKNRLTVAKQVVRDFIAKRTGDRIGVTIFGGSALTRSPLTTDSAMLDELVSSIELNTVQDGTAIGVALANAESRLKDSAAKSKVIVLVTDGANNAGEIDPLSAAAVAQGLGIKVYTIGVGREGHAPVTVPIQMRNPLTGRSETQRVSMIAEVDEKLLRAIAERTGGTYFSATDPGTLRAVFDRIDLLEKTPMQVKRYIRYRESFQPFAWTAFAFLLLPFAAGALRLTAEP